MNVCRVLAKMIGMTCWRRKMHQRRIIRSIEIEMIIEIIVGSMVLGIMTTTSSSSSNSGINIHHDNMKVEVVDFMNNEGIHHNRDHVDKRAGVVVVVAVAFWALMSQTKRVHCSLLREYERTKVVVIVVLVEEKEGITICTVWTIIIMFFLRVTTMDFGAIIHHHNVIIA